MKSDAERKIEFEVFGAKIQISFFFVQYNFNCSTFWTIKLHTDLLDAEKYENSVMKGEN